VEASIPAEEVFPELADATKKPGVMLRGARLKEELTQVQLAKKIGIPHSHISAMENGSRPIGKNMARRFAKFLKTDYRLLL
jgi:plasmid maintenance system antidote protein VapI